MKQITLMIISAFISLCVLSCSKSELTPPTLGQETMKLNKSSVSLEYCKRDTLKVMTAGVDQSKVKYSLYPKESDVVQLAGNVIIARKRGTCQVIAESEDGKVATCNVTVTTEEYVRITELIIEVNGAPMSSKDTLRSKEYQTVDIRVVGYKPANATNPVIKKTELWNDDRTTSSMGPNQQRVDGNYGNSYDDDITLRYKIWTDAKFYDNTSLNLFKGNIDKKEVKIKFDTPEYNDYYIEPDGSVSGCPDYVHYYFKFRFEAFPEDIVLTEEEQKFKNEMEKYDWCKSEINPRTWKEMTLWSAEEHKFVDYDYIAGKHKMCVNYIFEIKP